MNINWELETESGDIDPMELLGDILISDGKKEIKEQDVFLDTWFSALISCYDMMKNNASGNIEMPDEPYPLRLDQKGNSWILRFRANEIEINSTSSFHHVLLQNTEKFIGMIKNHEKFSQNPLLKKIIDFQ